MRIDFHRRTGFEAHEGAEDKSIAPAGSFIDQRVASRRNTAYVIVRRRVRLPDMYRAFRATQSGKTQSRHVTLKSPGFQSTSG